MGGVRCKRLAAYFDLSPNRLSQVTPRRPVGASDLHLGELCIRIRKIAAVLDTDRMAESQEKNSLLSVRVRDRHGGQAAFYQYLCVSLSSVDATSRRPIANNLREASVWPDHRHGCEDEKSHNGLPCDSSDGCPQRRRVRSGSIRPRHRPKRTSPCTCFAQRRRGSREAQRGGGTFVSIRG